MKVLLTGGSIGIGKSIKTLFENKGHHVWSPTKDELNLIDPPYIENANYDVVINNAGVNMISELSEVNYEEIDMMQINFFSPLLIIKQCLPYMINNKYGRIVNIGSIWTKLAKSGRSNYSASKSALDSLSKSITAEYTKHNILCNTISPGFIATDLTYKNNTEEELSIITSQVPVGRLGNPDEIANLVYFLTIENTFITGQNILIDGGFSCVV